MNTEYAIRISGTDDYIRELSEYVTDNNSRIKTFNSIQEAKIYIQVNDLDPQEFIVEEV